MMSANKTISKKPKKKTRMKKEKHFPEDAHWFQYSFDEPSLLDMKDFVSGRLGVPNQSPEFDNVMLRVAWAMHKLVERWDIKPLPIPSYKSRVGVLIDAFEDGSANVSALEQTMKRPCVPEATIYGDHDYELTEKAKAFFVKCKAM